ncbi:ribonucleoside-triphosphate reductase [Marine Group I thaumarchaeote]|uniref:Ribonucleoside-triphosphate reductase n=1 Tax=Marine Group I thaumarchaeote TaxID=2511932 RepID=A0A7K4N3P1_9ARCH|nr:ribonucleoside-triphosphate reductase [Marine Group I thaumarchaeote]
MLPTEYQQFIHLSRYARWDYDKERRETWYETVERYFDFFTEHLEETCKYVLTNGERVNLENAVKELNVMPSMRCLMTAGPALKKENVSGYNCSYVKVDSQRSFDEILYVLMNGTGVGFSVEEAYTNQLPIVPDQLYETDTTIVVADSKLGWARAFKELISLLYGGHIPKWDVSKVRPAGAPLKTFGGRASGPDPLVDLFNFTVNTFKNSVGRKLKPIECHDIVCKTAEIVVVGGVRRSALISLSDLNDREMRFAKSGQWWEKDKQRSLANNSVNYKEKPDVGTFMREWLSLYDSKSGERGIYNGSSAKHHVNDLNTREKDTNGTYIQRRVAKDDFGTNPCSEIILRSREFCNLSEVVLRSNDTLQSIKDKIRIATILGTFQSTLTSFKYLSREWGRNCEDERLLGVSLTGIMDCAITNGSKGNIKKTLNELRDVAVETNKEYAEKLGINRAAAITCVKPSGTVSQLVDSASGIHARHNPYYIRTVRADNKDPLCKMMKEEGFPNEPDVSKPDHTTVFSFPAKSPRGAICRNDMTAWKQLSLWHTYAKEWCEHKPSVTVSVKEEEWVNTAAWVYDNFDDISGISFLPFSDHSYRQAPYQDCSEEEYKELVKKMPKNVNWGTLAEYETKDYTSASQEFACTSAGGCELVDITPA